MKALIAILILLSGVFLFTQLVGFYKRSATPQNIATEPQGPVDLLATDGQSLPGLPSYLEASLADAQQQGVEGLGKWLKDWGKQVQDPRLAWIELDYAVLLNLKNHADARERFRKVQARIGPDSPVHPRVVKLAPAYEH